MGAILWFGIWDLTSCRPIMALVGGLEAPPGRIMGHAGAWAAPGEPDAQTKYQALERAGAVMVNHPERFGEGMKTLLAGQTSRPGTSVSWMCEVKRLSNEGYCTDIPVACLRDQLAKARLSHFETSHSSL